MPRLPRLARLPEWPLPFDPAAELDWSDPTFSRRLLGEHLDQSHDGASRRQAVVDRHVRRLRMLLPPPPARILDAGCGPGLYAIRLARLGYTVDGVDVGPAVIAHARREARREGLRHLARFWVQDIRDLPRSDGYDAILLIYYVLENLPVRSQVAGLRRLAGSLRPGGRMIVELRLRPDQLPGRISAWEVTSRSLLGRRRQLLLSDTVYDRTRNLFMLREVAIFGDGTAAVQQTTSRLLGYAEIPEMLTRAGLAMVATYDGWTAHPGSPLCDSLLVVAERSSPGLPRPAPGPPRHHRPASPTRPRPPAAPPLASGTRPSSPE
ncbi:MAG TPA: methyltransferase domain-containing protein [Candidatus Binatia bacterium]|nr:methyltransferase domain-containing protein [Candidatus Binatia bacterium]